MASGFSRAARTCAVIALTLSASVAAQAQLAELQPGVRFRFRASGVLAGRVTATVIERSADSLSFAGAAGGLTRIALSSLESAEVSRGRSRARGAIRGVLWGLGFGALSGLIADSNPGQCGYQATCESTSRGEAVAVSGVGGATLGAISGAIIGSERWVRLSLPARVSLLPLPHGAAVGLSVRF